MQIQKPTRKPIGHHASPTEFIAVVKQLNFCNIVNTLSIYLASQLVTLKQLIIDNLFPINFGSQHLMIIAVNLCIFYSIFYIHIAVN